MFKDYKACGPISWNILFEVLQDKRMALDVARAPLATTKFEPYLSALLDEHNIDFGSWFAFGGL